jgi:cysteine synthase A
MIVESSSGSFGLALAMVARLSGYSLTLVSDPVVDGRFSRRLQELGVKVEIVSVPAASGGIQAARLNRVAEVLDCTPGAFWPRQYDNPLNPESYRDTAKFLLRSLGRIDALVGTVGSGGSMCGMAEVLREANPGVRIVGVDTFGSILFGQKDSKRLLRGLGNSIMPGVLDHTAFDEVHWVSAAQAFWATRELHSSTALYRGPTSGAAWMVAASIARQTEASRVVVVFADEGYRYEDDVYNDDWLQARHLEKTNGIESPQWVSHPLEAREPWAAIGWRRRTLQSVVEARSGVTIS